MNILVACEESQAVTIELRRRGHSAYSCDLLQCSGGHPEWHIQKDVRELLKYPWDMILAFPPCTDLTSAGARSWPQKQKDGRQQAAINFFLLFTQTNCQRVAIENPVGIISTVYRKPDQIIRSYEFGDAEGKSTCLWLYGLPKLTPTHIVDRGPRYYPKTGHGSYPLWYSQLGRSKNRAILRSKTSPGIALAMAEQWT